MAGKNQITRIEAETLPSRVCFLGCQLFNGKGFLLLFVNLQNGKPERINKYLLRRRIVLQVYVCIYVCTYVYMYVCIYMYV
jgi:hypothetical protein